MGMSQSGRPNPVHPHVCGDFPCIHSAKAGCNGSPPRMWGLQHLLEFFAELLRFTPTYVGTSFDETVSLFRRQVHPHVCGDFYRKL